MKFQLYFLLIFLGIHEAVGLIPRLAYGIQYSTLRTVSLDSSGVQAHLPINCNALAYDSNNNWIYWSSGDAIYRQPLDGAAGAEHVLDVPGPYAITGLAYDWIADNIYYYKYNSAVGSYPIGVCSARSRNCTDIVQDKYIRDLALYPQKGEIYWASRTFASSGGGIYKAGMDGSSPTLILDVGYVEGINIDYEKSRIYWTVARTLRIFGPEMYWLQSGIGIRAASKFDGSNERPVISGSITTDFLTVLSSEVQPNTRVNHCAGNPCSHICVLTASNYRCLCPEGLQLNKTDGKTCYGDARLVYWSNTPSGLQIQTLLFNSSIRAEIPVGTGQPGGLAYDMEQQKLYWSLKHKNAIFQSNMDGSGREQLLTTGGISVRGLFYDWIAKNIYYTDDVLGHIGVCSLATKSCAVILNNATEPVDVTVRPRSGYVYWTDIGTKVIMRAYMNGSSPAPVLQSSLQNPVALAVDQESLSETVSYVDSMNYKIGVSAGTFTSVGIPLGIDVRRQYTYWAEYNKDGSSTIKRVPRSSTTAETFYSGITGQVRNLKIVTWGGQPLDRENHCEGHSCSHICVLNAESFECLCPEGMHLGSDRETCAA